MRWVAAVVIVIDIAIAGGCYSPPALDSACSITCTAACPSGLTCSAGVCVAPGQTCTPGGSDVDAASGGAIDAALPGRAFAQISAGTGFACAVDATGALWCWGSNLHNVIDASATVDFAAPTQIGSAAWKHVEAGGDHVCAIDSSDALWCWGANTWRQVDTQAVAAIPATTPHEIVVTGVTAWTAASAGDTYTCAIASSGALYCWGNDDADQLGAPNTGGSGTPEHVMPAITDWSAVSAGQHHTCAVSTSAGAYCWGTNEDGQLGPNGTIGTLSATPLAVPLPDGGSAIAIAVSDAATCATVDTASQQGLLYCWGHNGSGELGIPPSGANSTTPTQVGTLAGWTQLDASVYAFCGLAGSDVYCWGTDELGGTGQGLWTASTFGMVATGASQVTVGWDIGLDSPDAGSYPPDELACALIGSAAQCWGNDRWGQLGIGAATMSAVPALVVGAHAWNDLAVGADHACGVDSGKAWCWGSTQYGQTTGVIAGYSGQACGAGVECDHGTPNVKTVAGTVTDVAAGARHTCALNDGAIACWGDNNAHELGGGSAGIGTNTIAVQGVTWTSLIDTGELAQCAQGSAMVGTTSTYCWGSDALFTGSAALATGDAATADAFAVGSSFACFLDDTHVLQCAGSDTKGQFGDNGAGTMNTGRTYAAIAASSADSACGITMTGGLECWGANASAQLGVASSVPIATPSPVTGVSGCTAVAMETTTTCALCGGDIYCWGDPTYGGFGDNTFGGALDPRPHTVAAPDGTPWMQLGAGTHFACGRTTDHDIYCWGSDFDGALGNGAQPANRPVPVSG